MHSTGAGASICPCSRRMSCMRGPQFVLVLFFLPTGLQISNQPWSFDKLDGRRENSKAVETAAR